MIGTCELHLGDCLDVMAGMPECSVDAIVTDPPYGLGFMGRNWDHGLPGVPFWEAALRVAKPGCHLLAFGGTRTFHRLTCALEDAGWEIRDDVAAFFSQSVAFALFWDSLTQEQRKLFERAFPAESVLAWVYGSGFPKSHNVSKAIDKAAGAERVAAAERVYADGHVQRNRNGRQASNSYELSKQVEPESNRIDTAPATPAAQLWDGWGTALKPAWEPIIVARKPLVGTVAANVQKWGCGALNIDGCRVGTEMITQRQKDMTRYHGNSLGAGHAGVKQTGITTTTEGRWPANLIHDGSEEVVGLFPRGSENKKGVFARDQNGGGGRGRYGQFGQRDVFGYGDSGSAARFFYCAKASRKERTANGKVDNKHPTVKPLSLMRYLVRLVSGPEPALVLDPFMGSGTTALACMAEGQRFVGIEQDPESMATARGRIEAAQEEGQPALFR